MIKRWEKGRAEVDRLIAENRVQRVSASRDLAEAMISQSEAHLTSAAAALHLGDDAGAFQLVYDAARKSLAAILANQGLRARGAGAHVTLYDVVRAQLDPPLGPIIDPFDWMRRLRNNTEYPDVEHPTATATDVREALPFAEKIVSTARSVIDRMPVY